MKSPDDDQRAFVIRLQNFFNIGFLSLKIVHQDDQFNLHGWRLECLLRFNMRIEGTNSGDT